MADDGAGVGEGHTTYLFGGGWRRGGRGGERLKRLGSVWDIRPRVPPPEVPN